MTTRPVEIDPLVLVMVGKPARGKSYTARKIARYLTWLGYEAQVFNVGSYRRERLGPGQDASFFDPDNPDGQSARRQMAEAALDDLITWMQGPGEVALYDATNSTHARRVWVRNTCQMAGLKVMFLELVSEDEALVEENVRETKVTSPDYKDVDPDQAVADFRQRLHHYESVYETVRAQDGSFIRSVDVGRVVVLHEVEGYLPARLLSFLVNLHLTPRPIYLTRHGESLYNLDHKVGGDPALSPAGQRYAERLSAFFREELPADTPLTVWTSTLRRTVQTARLLGRPARAWKLLDEIDAGRFDGMSYEQIAEHHPEEFSARAADKFRYRYPLGESYQDVIARVEPAIIECERQRDPILIVAHQAVLRALYAYLADKDPSSCPFLAIPLHTVIKLEPKAYGCVEQRIFLGPDPSA